MYVQGTGTWLALFTTQIDRCLEVLNGRTEEAREEGAGVSVMGEVHGLLAEERMT